MKNKSCSSHFIHVTVSLCKDVCFVNVELTWSLQNMLSLVNDGMVLVWLKLYTPYSYDVKVINVAT